MAQKPTELSSSASEDVDKHGCDEGDRSNRRCDEVPDQTEHHLKSSALSQLEESNADHAAPRPADHNETEHPGRDTDGEDPQQGSNAPRRLRGRIKLRPRSEQDAAGREFDDDADRRSCARDVEDELLWRGSVRSTEAESLQDFPTTYDEQRERPSFKQCDLLGRSSHRNSYDGLGLTSRSSSQAMVRITGEVAPEERASFRRLTSSRRNTKGQDEEELDLSRVGTPLVASSASLLKMRDTTREKATDVTSMPKPLCASPLQRRLPSQGSSSAGGSPVVPVDDDGFENSRERRSHDSAETEDILMPSRSVNQSSESAGWPRTTNIVSSFKSKANLASMPTSPGARLSTLQSVGTYQSIGGNSICSSNSERDLHEDFLEDSPDDSHASCASAPHAQQGAKPEEYKGKCSHDDFTRDERLSLDSAVSNGSLSDRDGRPRTPMAPQTGGPKAPRQLLQARLASLKRTQSEGG